MASQTVPRGHAPWPQGCPASRHATSSRQKAPTTTMQTARTRPIESAITGTALDSMSLHEAVELVAMDAERASRGRHVALRAGERGLDAVGADRGDGLDTGGGGFLIRLA